MMQHRLSLFACDALEGVQEIIERESVSEIIEQRLHRKPRAAEDRSASENPGVRYYQPTCRAPDLSNTAHK